MAGLAEVAVEVNVNRLFEYSIPESERGVVRPGMRVRVPFGSRNLKGFVVSLAEREPPEGAKPISGAVETFPVLSPPLIRLGLWMSGYYVCAPGEVFKMMLPGKARLKEEKSRENSVEMEKYALPQRFLPVNRCMNEGKAGVFLLKRTSREQEDCLELLKDAVSSGRQAVVRTRPALDHGRRVERSATEGGASKELGASDENDVVSVKVRREVLHVQTKLTRIHDDLHGVSEPLPEFVDEIE